MMSLYYSTERILEEHISKYNIQCYPWPVINYPIIIYHTECQFLFFISKFLQIVGIGSYLLVFFIVVYISLLFFFYYLLFHLLYLVFLLAKIFYLIINISFFLKTIRANNITQPLRPNYISTLFCGFYNIVYMLIHCSCIFKNDMF